MGRRLPVYSLIPSIRKILSGYVDRTRFTQFILTHICKPHHILNEILHVYDREDKKGFINILLRQGTYSKINPRLLAMSFTDLYYPQTASKNMGNSTFASHRVVD